MRTKAEIQTRFSSPSDLDGVREFFLVGIGGAGLAGVAQMLLNRGFAVSGSDSTASPVIGKLIASGATVHIGHSSGLVPEGCAVVLTDAIDLEVSPEVRDAERMGCALFRRSQVLGWLVRDKRVIAVTGTHGKTTTTGLLAAALRGAGFDPTVVVGAEVPEFGGAVLEGSSDIAVIEACEAYDSFRDLDPEIVILTNLEADHLDFHGTWESLRSSVDDFIAKIPAGGALVYCAEDVGAGEIGESFGGNKVGYTSEGWNSGVTASMRLPGKHNWLNAQGAIEAARIATGATREELLKGILPYGGAERRLQLLREGEIAVVDDYAHHPTEIRASIDALRSRYPERRLVVVYQPHLYSRTADFLDEFAKALSLADLVVITDIYAAREAPIAGMSSARIAELLTCPNKYVPSRFWLPLEVRKLVKAGDVVVGMGAGDIGDFAPAFVKELDRSVRKKIAVAYAGDSSEREVSIHSGRAIYNALREKYDCELIDITTMLMQTGSVAGLIGSNRPDLVVLGVHGTHAEDGVIQGFLELIGMPYTGSGLLASALAMDKQRTKDILVAAGLPVPQGVLVRAGDDLDEAIEEAMEKVRKLRPGQFVVKPNAQGSTVGVSFVETEAEIRAAIVKGLSYDSSVLIEERIIGMEISTPVLGDRVLFPVEIVPTSGQYDFASKYAIGATEEICPARLPEDTLELVRNMSLQAHQALGCSGATRTDMIVMGEEPIILEVNTLPGMTPTSLLPKSAETCGISFVELCEWIVQDALKRHVSV